MGNVIKERERITGIVEGMKSKNGGGQDYDEIENKDYNNALDELIAKIKENEK